MKKCYYLVAALMLMGSTPILTGCIDNDEPAGIEELRGAKAELIKAHAAVKAAEVAYKEAEAAMKQAEVEGQLIANEIEKCRLRIAEAEAKLAEAQGQAEIDKLQKEMAKYEAEANAYIAEQEARQKAAEAAYKQAEVLIQQALNSLEVARMDFTVQQKKVVDQLCQELRNAQAAVQTALNNRNAAEVAYQRALANVDSNTREADKIKKTAQLEVQVMVAQAAVDANKKTLAKAEEDLAKLNSIVPEDLAKFEEELQKDVDKLVMDYLMWEKDHYFVEKKDLLDEENALKAEKKAAQAKVSTIKDVTFEVDESVEYWNAPYSLFTDKNGEFVTKKSLLDFVNPTVDGVEIDVMEYSLDDDANYKAAERSLKQLKQTFQDWANVSDVDVWAKVAEKEKNVEDLNKSLEESTEKWNKVVALYKSGENLGHAAEVANVEGYAEMKAQVDKMNAIVAEIEKANKDIVAAGDALQAAYDKKDVDTKVAQKQLDEKNLETNRQVDLDAEKEEAVNQAKNDAVVKANDEWQEALKGTDEAAKKAAEKKYADAEKALEEYQKSDNYKHYIQNPDGYKAELRAKNQKAFDEKAEGFEKAFKEALAKAETVIQAAQVKVSDNRANLYKQYTEEGAAALKAFDDNAKVDTGYGESTILGQFVNSWWSENIESPAYNEELHEVGYLLSKAGSVLSGTYTNYVYAPEVMKEEVYSTLDQNTCKNAIESWSEQLWGFAFRGSLNAVTEADIEEVLLAANNGKELLPSDFAWRVSNYGLLGQKMSNLKYIELFQKKAANDELVAGLLKKAEDALDALKADKKALTDAQDAVTLKEAEVAKKQIKLDGEKTVKQEPLKSQHQYLQNVQKVINDWILYASENNISNQEGVKSAVEFIENQILTNKQNQVTVDADLDAAQNTLKMWKDGKLSLSDAEKEALEDAEAKLKAAQEELNVQFTRLQTWLDKLGVDFDKDAYLK